MSSLPIRRLSAALAGGLLAAGAALFVGGLVSAQDSLEAGGFLLNPASGNSETVFTGVLQGPGGDEPADVFCPGDGIEGYRWSTFIVPPGTDIASLTWGAVNPTGFADIVPPLFPPAFTTSAGGFAVTQLPGQGDGFVNIPLDLTFDSATLGGNIPAGDYLIGVACLLPSPTGDVPTTKYWVGDLTITDAPGEGPYDFTYESSLAAPVDTTTTTTTTTAPSSSTTSTTAASTTSTTAATTTTVAGGSTTTTTVAGGTTTTSVASGAVTTTTIRRTGTGSGSGSGTGSGSGGGSLAATGSDIGWWLAAGAVFVMLGRMVVLAARRPGVRPPTS